MTSEPAPKPQIPLLLSGVFIVYLGQMTLNPIIAPLAREVGLAEWQIGATISAAALTLAIMAQFWGRRAQSWGSKPVLVFSFALATATMALFGLVALLGMGGVLTGTGLFLLFLLLRGFGYGAAIAAVPTTAQTYIAAVTHDPAARLRGMSGIGAAHSSSMIAGAALGGVLAAFGLALPLIIMPIILVVGLLFVSFKLRPEPHAALVKRPSRVSPLDPRVWPFLVVGFGMFTALGFVQVITGFLVQDRLGLDAQATSLVTGITMLGSGVGLLVAQASIAARPRWSTRALLRTGTIVGLSGYLLLIPDLGAVALIGSSLIIGLGIGIAVPGYNAGPSLLLRREEQGGLAGLINGTNGLTFVVAPVLSTALYGTWAPLPVVLGAVVMAIVALFLFLHPRFRGGSSSGTGGSGSGGNSSSGGK